MVCQEVFLYLFSLPSAFVVVGRFAPDEERLVLLKLFVQFSFTYGVSRSIFIFVYTATLPSVVERGNLYLHYEYIYT